VLALLAAAALTWVRPVYGLALLILIDPFDLSRATGETTITPAQGGLDRLLAARWPCAARRCGARRRSVRPILFGAAAIVVATMLAATQADLAPALRESAKALEYLAAFAGAALAYSRGSRRTHSRVCAWPRVRRW
jgi:hypothetical protein